MNVHMKTCTFMAMYVLLSQIIT